MRSNINNYTHCYMIACICRYIHIFSLRSANGHHSHHHNIVIMPGRRYTCDTNPSLSLTIRLLLRTSRRARKWPTIDRGPRSMQWYVIIIIINIVIIIIIMSFFILQTPNQLDFHHSHLRFIASGAVTCTSCIMYVCRVRVPKRHVPATIRICPLEEYGDTYIA